MTKQPMGPADFERLLAMITQETSLASKKLEVLYNSRGCFDALQAARILEAIAIPSHKVGAVRIMEPRLCPMTCDEARMILACVTLQDDKVAVLDSLKRVLVDCQTQLGQEFILSSYPFEGDKHRALSILHTVQSDTRSKLPAGGHQGYAALGGLYTQARPLNPHLYGSIAQQSLRMPGQGVIEILPQADPNLIPSKYTGHPSYAYPQDKSYIESRDYPGPPHYLDEPVLYSSKYPAGAPPLGYHQGAPAPVGYPGLS